MKTWRRGMEVGSRQDKDEVFHEKAVINSVVSGRPFRDMESIVI